MTKAAATPQTQRQRLLQPRQLLPEDIPQLNLSHHPRLDSTEATELVSRAPGASWWIPETGEFMLAAPWRHRSQLLTIQTFGAFGNEAALMNAVIGHAESDGRAGIVIVDLYETRPQSFFDRYAFTRIEELVTYAHRHPEHLLTSSDRADIEFVEVSGTDPALLAQVISLDHQAFPWFWWNSEAEFAACLADPAIEVWAGFHEEALVAYIGITRYRRWGHLDRIAVAPTYQGRGFGRSMLRFAARRLVEQGAQLLALSTQFGNARSRALYEGMGFTHTHRDDYAVYARIMDPDRIRARAGDIHPSES